MGTHVLGLLPAILPCPSDASLFEDSENEIIRIFERATPSVAFVSTFEARFDHFSKSAVESPLGAGSGIVWGDEGFVVTNFHVIRNSEACEITLTDSNGVKTAYPASLQGFDADQDVAVLKIETPNVKFSPITLGASAGLRVGQAALAIGNPFGLDHTLTTGVVSGLGREVTAPSGRPIFNVIQTDASINPGASFLPP